MSNILVVYKSKYGATEQYAEWLKEELGCEMISADECKLKDLEAHDTIIFGGGIHAGGITGISLIKKNFKKIQDKKLIVFAVGINVEGEKNMEDIRDINFRGKLSEVPCYLLKGAYDPNKITGFDSFLMKQVRKMIMKKPIIDREPQERELVKVIDYGGNWIDKASLAPIIEAVKEEI